MPTTYQFKEAGGTQPTDQKLIESTATVQEKRVFTLADKQREVETLTVQIADLTKRKTDLQAEITSVKTALNIGGSK